MEAIGRGYFETDGASVGLWGCLLSTSPLPKGEGCPITFRRQRVTDALRIPGGDS